MRKTLFAHLPNFSRLRRLWLAANQTQRKKQIPRAESALGMTAQCVVCAVVHKATPQCDELGKFYGQAERPISTGKLRALLRFHTRPIKVVVFDRPYYPPVGRLGDLILRRASCLDAFSNYLFRTSLPSDAPGGTARTQEVRPSRSSRTRDSSSQVSCAHTR